MRTLIAALAAACICGPATAASTDYFLEGVFGGGAGNIEVDEVDSPEVTFNRASVDLTVNLGSVSTYDIPYSESQFLNRASFIKYSQENIGTDDVDAQVSRQVTGRYVLRSGLYFTAIGDLDPDDSENNTYEIQVGKFTDQSSSMYAGYVVDQLDDVDIFTAGIHHASPYIGENTWLAYDFGGKYLMEGSDNEYAVNIGATYYTSLRASLGVWYEYTDARLTDSHETNVFGEFYFSRSFSTRLDVTAFRFGNVDENSAGVSLKLRF